MTSGRLCCGGGGLGRAGAGSSLRTTGAGFTIGLGSILGLIGSGLTGSGFGGSGSGIATGGGAGLTNCISRTSGFFGVSNFILGITVTINIWSSMEQMIAQRSVDSLKPAFLSIFLTAIFKATNLKSGARI